VRRARGGWRQVALGLGCAATLATAASAQEGFRPYEVTERHDPTGEQVVFVKHDSYLADARGRLSMNLQRTTSSTARVSYQLFLTYDGPDWMLIDGDAPAVIGVDGERAEAQPFGRALTYTTAERVTERQAYRIDPDVLRRMASAREVRLALPGRRFTQPVRFSRDNFRIVRAFVARYVPPPAVSVR